MHNFPTPIFIKQPQTITEPSPCLTVDIVYLWSNSSYQLLHIIIRPSDPNKLNFNSSDQTIVSQKLKGLRSISFAYLKCSRRLVLFTYGFFRTAQPNSSTSCARRLTVDSLISIPRSFSDSTVTVRIDIHRLIFNFR